MKRGQVFSLVILIFLLIISGFLFYQLTKSKLTGNSVSDQNMTNNLTALKHLGCKISSPFYCNIWKISKETNELTIQLENARDEDYIIRSITLSGCQRKTNSNLLLIRRTAQPVDFICSSVNALLGSQMVIEYKLDTGGLFLKVNGSLLEK